MSSSFADLGVSDALCAALQRGGIDLPFPVQAATLPDALAGRDLCAMAPTGSGKTLAFGITLLERVPKGRPHQPSALVLVPTRELAQQVVGALVPLAPAARRYVSAFYGGAGMTFQIDQLRRGIDIAVGTPGRLIDLLRRNELDLSACSFVVVDEADRMADMGFMPQISELLDCVPDERQVLLFSATLDGDVGSLVECYLHDPVRHQVDGQHGAEDDEELAAALRAPHYRVLVKHETKIDVMADLCRASHRSIVFARNRFASERMAAALEERGVSAVFLHGGMSQSKRQQAVRAFTNGEVTALVATDLAARGLHVDGVSLVLHLDPPQDWKDYIHRSGRTARAGARGVVVNLLRREQLRAGDKMESELGVTSTTVDLDVVVKELESIPPPEAKRVHIHVDTDDTPSEEERSRGRGGFGGGRPEGRRGRPGGDRERLGGYGSRGPRRFERDDRPARPAARPERGDGSWLSREERGDRPSRDSDAARFEHGGRDTRPAFGDRDGFARPERPRFERGGRDARPERAGWSPRGTVPGDRGDRSPRPWEPRGDRADRPGRPWTSRDERSGRPASFDRGPRPDRLVDGRFVDGRRPFDRGPRDGGFDRPTRFDRDDRQGSAERGPRHGGGSRPAFGERPRFHDGPGRGPRPGGDRFDARPARAPKPARRDGAPVSAPRFADDGTPLNRKARRALQFGGTDQT